MGTLVSLTGPSASGKSTLERELERKGFKRLISFTTRPMREGERDHVDYHFITHEQARELVEGGETLQHVEFNGNIYGTMLSDLKFLEGEGARAVVVVEPNGVNNIKAAMAKLDLPFRYMPTYVYADTDILMERMVERYFGDDDMTMEAFQSRWRSLMDVEMATWIVAAQYDYHARNNDSIDAGMALRGIEFRSR